MSVADFINKILKTLPVGFRFHPTDEELVDHYLKSMVQGTGSPTEVIPVVEVCKREPEELPGLSMIKTGDPDWFFFCPVDYKNSNCSQMNRQTGAGYWKPTGTDREIKSGNNKIGTKKTLVFHRGRGRSARRTNWVIHEYQYRPDFSGIPSNKAYVLCHLMRKTDENASPDVLILDEAAAGTGFGNGVTNNNMGVDVGSSHRPNNIASEIGNYQLEEMALDEDPDVQDLLRESRLPALVDDMLAQSEQVLESDLWSPPGFIHSHGTVQFESGDDAEFADSLFIDEDGFPCGGAIESGNQRRGSISRLSAHPKSPLKGTYVDSGVPISGSTTQMLNVEEASSRVVPDMKKRLKSPMAQQKDATSGSISIMPQLRESIEPGNKSVALGVPPKSVKLEGNGPNNEILIANLAKLSCSIPKPDEKPALGKAEGKGKYGSAIDQPQNKNPMRESTKECEVTQKENPKLSSVIRWNEPLKPEAASASDDSSSSPPELINFVVGIVLLVILIVVMVLDIMALR